MLQPLPALCPKAGWRATALSALLGLLPLHTSHAQAPVAVAADSVGLQLQLLSTYQTGVFNEGAAEIAAYDAGSQLLFVINAGGATVDVLNVADPTNPTKATSVDIAALTGGGSPNSIAVANGLVAVAVEADPATDPGVVLIGDVLTVALTGQFTTVPVGALPDMLTFTPNGAKILVANEGEPGEEVDPEGSVTIIDLSNGYTNPTATTVSFAAYNGREMELRSRGVRLFTEIAAANDFEPEYIAVSPDGTTAFVTLQEANAFAVIDIATAALLDIYPLGWKLHDRGRPELTEYTFNEPVLGQDQLGNDVLFGGLSGLFFEAEVDGKYQFLTVPDRGPNGAETDTGRVFLLPDYEAKLYRFTMDPATGLIDVVDTVMLYRPSGDSTLPITGFPNLPGVDEKPIDGLGNVLPYDPYGADLEGIVKAPDGSFWMVDEYRPSLYHFSAEGELINRFVPEGTAALVNEEAGTFGDETLPAVYATRRSNRGFEGMALDTDNNILYAFIQTPLQNPDRAASDDSQVIRILGIDPTTGSPVAEYVYLLEKPERRKSLVDKIGDAAWDASTGRIYVIERDSDVSSAAKKYIFEIDLRGATNLLAREAPELLANGALEQYTPDQLDSLGIRPVFKAKVLNLPSVGYLPSDKAEGVTVLPDGSLAVINDNDFGLEGSSDVSLGVIRFTGGNGLDASDDDEAINIQNWPVYGMFMPDGIASFEANGETYYITANEGDDRGEDERVEDLELDEVAFPEAATLQEATHLGRLGVSSIDGDLDADGDYDRLFAYGARSLTIWDAYGNLVWDSGDAIEQVTAATYPDDFNSTNDENGSFDSRSDAKGPEPEGVTTGVINGRTYAFVGLERIGGVMVYDVTNPTMPQYAAYVNNRDFSGDAEAGTAGDLGPEGLVFIPAESSPNGEPMLVVANEISGSTSLYGIKVDTLTTAAEELLSAASVQVYPVPFAHELHVRFREQAPQEAGVLLFNTLGAVVLKTQQPVRNGEVQIATANLPHGVYFVQLHDAQTGRLLRSVRVVK